MHPVHWADPCLASAGCCWLHSLSVEPLPQLPSTQRCLHCKAGGSTAVHGLPAALLVLVAHDVLHPDAAALLVLTCGRLIQTQKLLTRRHLRSTRPTVVAHRASCLANTVHACSSAVPYITYSHPAVPQYLRRCCCSHQAQGSLDPCPLLCCCCLLCCYCGVAQLGPGGGGVGAASNVNMYSDTLYPGRLCADRGGALPDEG